MTALWHRDRTGEGQLIEIAQAENAACMFTQAIMDYSLNGNIQGANGNRDVHGRAPFGVYPTVSPGTSGTSDDHWIAIAIEDDAQWQEFGIAIGSPEWAGDARFASNAGRLQHHDELDALIGEYTATQNDYELMHRLQAAGVSAAPVLEASRMFSDPHLRDRDFFQEQTQPSSGTYEYVGPLWKLPETPVEFVQPPVMFGEHNDYVYREVLKVSDAEYASLKAGGHIATEYDASVP
jgi:crotonobetainyl-CoA:carnitine CoA-transferase CaiB-like acyl-CoA transferase